eukprot:gene4482-8919_t
MDKRPCIIVLIGFYLSSIVLCVHERYAARDNNSIVVDEYAKNQIFAGRHYGNLNGLNDEDELDETNEEDEDGAVLARILAREAMYGTNYSNDPAYGQHYISQVEAKMQSVVLGESWASIGPTYTPYPYLDSGRVRCILQHSTNRDKVYILTSGGGLWMTTNFFVTSPTWTPLTDQLVTTSGGYAAFGSDPETIYLGLGDPFDRGGAGGYFTKTTDGGATWSTPLSLAPLQFYYDGSVTQVFTIVVDTSTGSSDILLLSNNVGIYRSIDGGATFTHPYNGYGVDYYPAIFSLVRTGNNGIFWWMAYDHLNKLLIVSSDTGATWGALAGTNWDTMVGSNAGRTTFAVGVPGDSIIYAQVAKSSDSTQLDILRSVNGGITWTSCHCNSNYAPTTKINNVLTDLNIMGSQGWYNHMLLVDPSDSARNTVYAGGNLASIKTTNGGNSWSVISTWYNPNHFTSLYGISYVHADFHAATYAKSPDGIATLIFGTDGGVFSSQNNGSSWSSNKNSGLVTQLPNFICGSPLLNRIMIGLQDLGSRERIDTDGSTTWEMVYGGDGDGCGYSQALNKVSLMSMYYNSMRCRYYVNGAFAGVYDCSSGIETDQYKPFYTNVRTPTAAADPTGTVFFTITFRSIYRSSMPSDTLIWNSIGTVGSNGISDGDIPGMFQTIGIGPTTTDQVAFAKDTEICITTNGGTSWTTVKISNTIAGWGYGTSPVWVSSTILYMSADNPTLGVTRFIKSTDTGATWISPNTGNKLPELPISKLLISNVDPTGNIIFAATWIGVYVTTDGGVNWNVLGSGLPNVVVTDMYQMSEILHVSTYGRGVWQVSYSSLFAPTSTPTSRPSTEPTSQPTRNPTTPPTNKPSSIPSYSPSLMPSEDPTSRPSLNPSVVPSNVPTQKPSFMPTAKPSKDPTNRPSKVPSTEPSTKKPSFMPTAKPSKYPTNRPSKVPSTEPSTKKPSFIPTTKPSKYPTNRPSKRPTLDPSVRPSRRPSSAPTKKP